MSFVLSPASSPSLPISLATSLPDALHYQQKQQQQQLYLEEHALSTLVQQHGTPAYVYSRSAIIQAYTAHAQAFASEKHLICYAVKANSNLSVLKLLADLGAGFDIVSYGELARVLAAGGTPDKVVFSGVGKTAHEIRQALATGIKCFNAESVAELGLIHEIALDMGKKAPVSIRINPDVDAGTHPYISTGLKENKFGIPAAEALSVYRYARQLSGITVQGIDCHIGSQILNIAVYADAVRAVAAVVRQLEADGIQLHHINFGGGLGITYDQEQAADPQQLYQLILHTLEQELPDAQKYQLIFEPGRSITGNAGVLLTRVLFTKKNGDKEFVIVDAAMNDLLRPSLYQAQHRVIPCVIPAPQKQPQQKEADHLCTYDIVGPVCETGDYLAKNCRMHPVHPGDMLAVLGAGAYGFVMASNYNSRPRAIEIMVSGARHAVVREREQIADLICQEHVVTDF